MSTQLQQPDTGKREKKEKKRRGAGLIILLIIVLILFLLSTAILGARLYKLATRDQYTVDLGLGNLAGKIELFRIEYANERGEITVRGVNADNVVAPGTTVSYDVRLRNNDDVIIDFTMIPQVEFFSGDAVPVAFKMTDTYGNYLLGSETGWADAADMNTIAHKGSIHPGEVHTYHIAWQWVFEVDDEQNAYDTYLGNRDGEAAPGLTVGITTEAVANPMPPKSNAHMMHLLGEGFGCCWCCYLVWILLLILLLLLIRNCFLRRKMNKQAQTLEEYEEVLIQNGLLVDGELVDRGPMES